MADSTTFTGFTNVVTTGAVANTIEAVTTAATFAALDSTQSCVLISGSTAAISIQGITAGIDGQRLTVISLGTGNLTFVNQSGSASTANRIITMTGSDAATTGNGAGDLVYSTSQARWLLTNIQV